jgi:hypothetical protein
LKGKTCNFGTLELWNLGTRNPGTFEPFFVMQRDELENFVLDKREAFDDAIPSLKVWADIDRALNKPSVSQPLTFQRFFKVAAAVAAILVVGGFGGNLLTRWQQADSTAIIEKVNPEYLEMEQYYRQQISTKVQQLARYEPNGTFMSDMKKMDKVMAELKEELCVAPKGQEEEIIATMIQTYQIKVAILERVLEQMRTSKPQPKKTTSNEEVSL